MAGRSLALTLALLISISTGAVMSVSVHLQTSGVTRSDSGLTWKGTLDQLSNLTVCVRVKLLQTRETNYVVSYANERSPNDLFIDVRYYQQEIRFGCCDDAMYFTFPVTVHLMTWLHFCVSIQFTKGLIHFQEGDGKVISRRSSRSNLFLKGNGVLILGQDQDSIGGETEASQSFHGYIEDLVMSKEILTNDAMKSYTSCKLQEIDPVVDFSNVSESFTFGEETEIVELGYEAACSGIHIYTALFPEPRNLHSSHRFCKSLGASLVVPKNALENDMVMTLGQIYCHVGRFWLGVQVVKHTGFYEYGTKKPINYTEWDHVVKLNSDAMAVLYTKRSLHLNNWGVSTYDRKMCVVCSDTKPLSFKVRGLCKDSKFDREFHISSYINNKPLFLGIKSSNISWFAYNLTRDMFSGKWMMKVSDEPFITASMIMETKYSYPVGTHTWIVDNDICVGDKIRLKFSTCKQGMFTCDDGSCVELKLRCNKIVDCIDSSDEARCSTILKPQEYDPNIPPPFQDKQFPAKIDIGAEFKFIRSIKILEFTLSLDMSLTRRWRDGRLRFKNLRQNLNHNVVEDIEMVWMPEITITGSDDLLANMEEKKSVNFVDKQGRVLDDDDTQLDEDQLYSGSENDLVSVREWTLELLCHYDLFYYPFDTQRCPVSIFLSKYTSDLFLLRMQNYTFSGNKRHHQYRVLDVILEPINSGGYGGQKLTLILRNQYIYYISAAYVPSCMLLIISYLTYYFRLDEFQTRISVALTSLLVLATLFSELVGGLPKTSYPKLIDVWFLGCIVSNFGMVICLVIIEKDLGKVKEKESDKNEAMAKNKWDGDKLVMQKRKSLVCMADGSRFDLHDTVSLSVSQSSLNTRMKLAIPILISIFIIAYCICVTVILYN